MTVEKEIEKQKQKKKKEKRKKNKTKTKTKLSVKTNEPRHRKNSFVSVSQGKSVAVILKFLHYQFSHSYLRDKDGLTVQGACNMLFRDQFNSVFCKPFDGRG